MSNMRLAITAEVVRSIDLELHSDSDETSDLIHFRVEILRTSGNNGVMFARIWRKEFYRIQPTFPQEESKPKHNACDELLLVEEVGLFEQSEVTAKSSDKVIDLVMKKLQDRFERKA